MARLWKKPEFLITVAGLAMAAVVVWLQWPAPRVLDVTHISNVEFHADLQQAGFDDPSSTAAFRPLVWDQPVHDEAGVIALVRSLDLAPATLAAGAHADFVSTQSSILVQLPVLNSILAWSNATTDLWILRQLYMVTGAPWRTYGLVQDKTAEPNRAFYFRMDPNQLTFFGQDCFRCHASGPRFMRSLRPDLVVGGSVPTIAAFNDRILANGYVEMHFSANDPAAPTGPALTATACVSCHQIGGERAPIYHAQDESIRALVDTGAMPRDRRMSVAQAAEVQAWLAAKRDE